MSRKANVRKTRWVSATKDAPGHNEYKDEEVTFLEFGTYYVELEKGIGQTSAAIVQYIDGTVEFVDLFQITFVV